jgi:hypothetical protein
VRGSQNLNDKGESRNEQEIDMAPPGLTQTQVDELKSGLPEWVIAHQDGTLSLQRFDFIMAARADNLYEPSVWSPVKNTNRLANSKAEGRTNQIPTNATVFKQKRNLYQQFITLFLNTIGSNALVQEKPTLFRRLFINCVSSNNENQ